MPAPWGARGRPTTSAELLGTELSGKGLGKVWLSFVTPLCSVLGSCSTRPGIACLMLVSPSAVGLLLAPTQDAVGNFDDCALTLRPAEVGDHTLPSAAPRILRPMRVSPKVPHAATTFSSCDLCSSTVACSGKFLALASRFFRRFRLCPHFPAIEPSHLPMRPAASRIPC